MVSLDWDVVSVGGIAIVLPVYSHVPVHAPFTSDSVIEPAGK